MLRSPLIELLTGDSLFEAGPSIVVPSPSVDALEASL